MTIHRGIINRISKLGAVAVLAATTVTGVGAVTASASPSPGPQYYHGRRVVRTPYRRPYSSYPAYGAAQGTGRAQQQGYVDGYNRGLYDRQTGRRTPNPAGHGAYQYALNGWTREFGSTGIYRQYYRNSFAQGYQDAFYGRGRRW
jgi:hypothetical protein